MFYILHKKYFWRITFPSHDYPQTSFAKRIKIYKKSANVKIFSFINKNYCYAVVIEFNINNFHVNKFQIDINYLSKSGVIKPVY